MGSLEPILSGLKQLDRFISHKEDRLLAHDLHDYPARFLPQIPKLLIENLSQPGDLVLDPMCGSGTCLELAARLQRQALGTDLNVISAMIIGALSSPRPSKLEIASFIENLSKDFEQGLPLALDLPTKEQFHNSNLWFRPEVLRELIYIKQFIDKSTAHLNFYKLALSRICKECSNSDPRDLFPQRDRAQPVRPRANVLGQFIKSLDKVSRLLDCKPLKLNFVQSDAQQLPLANNLVDLIVFSPPYSYALEYVRVHQLSLSVLGYSRKHLREHRRLYLGTDKIESGRNPDSDLLELYQGILVDSQQQKWSRYFLFFLIGMHKVMAECQRVLKPGAHLSLVIGNSNLQGSKLSLPQVLKMVAFNLDFEKCLEYERPYYRYRLNPNRNLHSNKIKSDFVMIFKKRFSKVGES